MLSLIPNKKNLSILCIGAHSDDIEIGCGCTLIKLLEDYSINKFEWIVVATDEQRKIEAKKSANSYLKNIFDSNISVLSFRDGYLPYQALEIKEEFEKIKKRINPDIIFTHYRNDLHQDHRLINDLTWNTFRNHLILEYEIPKWDGDIGNPNLFVELSEDILNKRNDSLFNIFESQKTKDWFTKDTFKSLARIRGIESNCKFAEAFYMRKLKAFNKKTLEIN